MSRQQMICFVTPGAPGEVPPSVMRRVDAMCRNVGRIHFAALALLPSRPGSDEAEQPSLMFEVVVDEDLAPSGLHPSELVDLMLDTAFAALWRLYKANWTGPTRAGLRSKRQWLRAFLLEHASLANGGFVGARDRTVAQVVAESRLFTGLRAALQQTPRAQRPSDAGALARNMVAWASRHGFDWIAQPAPRSDWRKGPDFGVGSWVALAGRLGVPVIALHGLLAALGGTVMLGAYGLAQLPVPLAPGVPLAVCLSAMAVLLVLLLPGVLAMFTGVGLLILAVQTVAFCLLSLGLLAGGLLAGIGEGSLTGLSCMVSLVLLGLSSVAVFVAAAVLLALIHALPALRAPSFFAVFSVLAGMALVGGMCWASARMMFAAMDALARCGYGAWSPLPARQDSVAALAWAAAALLTVAGALRFTLYFSTREAPPFLNLGTRLNRPGPLPDLPAHQTHPSVQACEAEQFGRTSHMISLTEIRRPYIWHRNWLRFWLWFFSMLGEYVFTEGRLGGASGIKFGHWHIIDGGRRLLFCSNFDTPLGGYLDDFILGASEGVNLIWRHTELRERPPARHDLPGVEHARQFPPTRLGIYRGCRAEQAFKAYTRASMLPYLYRFEAYWLTNGDIERATRLREALRGTRSQLKDDQVARALES